MNTVSYVSAALRHRSTVSIKKNEEDDDAYTDSLREALQYLFDRNLPYYTQDYGDRIEVVRLYA